MSSIPKDLQAAICSVSAPAEDNFHNDPPPANAELRLFTTFELLEQILLEIPIATLRHARRVNHTFCSTISNSLPLQRRLYFLRDTVQRYAEVASAVNRQEMARFSAEIRKRWHPEELEEFDERWGKAYRKGEGWTSEGGLAMCIWNLAFDHWTGSAKQWRKNYGIDIRPQGELCEAERWDQVLLHRSVESLVDELPRPLIDADPARKLEEKFEELVAALQQQCDARLVAAAKGPKPTKPQTSNFVFPKPTARQQAWVKWRSQQEDVVASLEKLVAGGRSDLANTLASERRLREASLKGAERRRRIASPDTGDLGLVNGKVQLPNEFKELMMLTNGIRGAGLPSENCQEVLVFSLDRHHADGKGIENFPRDEEPYTALAAWRIGMCGFDDLNREISFVLCYDASSETAADAKWRVYDHYIGCHTDTYESMAQFLRNETVKLEEKLAGESVFYTLDFDSYPAP